MAEVEYRLGAPHIGLENRIRLQNPLLLTAPVIAGLTTVGSLLTVTDPTFRVGAVMGTLYYQWYRGGTPIGGATASTYTIVAADLAQRLSCRVHTFYSGYKKKYFSNVLVGT